MATATLQISDYLGKPPDRLSLAQRTAAAGKWIALEMYTPETLPLKVIEAIGDSPAECISQVESRGLDPRSYEFSVIFPAF